MTAAACPPTPGLTGAVLAGGAGRRMGRDKAFVEVDGGPLVLRVASQLAAWADRVLVAGGDAPRLAALGLEVVPDARPGEGPLMGIAGALAAARTDLVLFAPCDLPEVPPALVAALLAAARAGGDGAVAVAADGRAHPLLAVYHRRLRPLVERLLATGERRARALLDHADLARVPIPPGAEPRNLNTPADVAAWTAATASGTSAAPGSRPGHPTPPAPGAAARSPGATRRRS